jgi:hypothetical protein
VVAGLLEDLAHQPVSDRLVELDPATGKGPGRVAVPLTVPPREQHALLPVDLVDEEDVGGEPRVVVGELHDHGTGFVNARASSRLKRPS